jgi:cyanophycin synthetase
MIDAALQEYKEKPGKCADCGNSPVNHFETYISQTLSVMSSNAIVRRSWGLRALVRGLIDRAAWWLEPALFRLIAALPGARFQTDPTKAKSYRSQVIWEEATRRGIRMEQLVVWGIYTDTYRAKLRGAWFYFVSIPMPPELENKGGEWMDDKYLLKKLLQREGVPVPRVESVTTLNAARRAFHDIASPITVKPRNGSRARHTTVYVHTDKDVVRAYTSAKRLCRYVLIEEYLKGGVSRATVVNGKLQGFFTGFPPTVIGDGTSTIMQLIEKKNQDRPDRVAAIEITDDHRAFLQRTGYSLDHVLPVGKKIPISPRTGRLFGGTTRELLGFEHPKLRAYVERAALALSTPLVGFDLIVENPEEDPDTQRWGIIEANSLPFIDLHYLPLEGKPSNVAASIWDLW